MQIPIFASLGLVSPLIANAGAATYTPVLPPSYPLAVRSPYLSGIHPPCQINIQADPSTAWMPGNQVANLATATPQFWTGANLTWSVLARVDGTAYKLFGAPESLQGSIEAELVSAEYTSTHSIFTLNAGGAVFGLDFFSPVSPKNYLRQSLPFGYLTVSVSGDGAKIQIYSDVDESWTGQAGQTVRNLNISKGVVFELSVDNAVTYEEMNDMALWGDVVFASRPENLSIVTYQSGNPASVRGQFASNGTLSVSAPTFVTGDVVGISHDLGEISNASVTFAMGYVREEAINYLGNARTGYYRASYHDIVSAVSYFFDDYAAANAESFVIDSEVEKKAMATAGTNYSDILTLTVRQVFGGSDLTIPGDSLDTSDVMVFLKEISSDGNVNTCELFLRRTSQGIEMLT